MAGGACGPAAAGGRAGRAAAGRPAAGRACCPPGLRAHRQLPLLSAPRGALLGRGKPGNSSRFRASDPNGTLEPERGARRICTSLGAGCCLGENHWKEPLSSSPLPLVTLTLLGVLPALGHTAQPFLLEEPVLLSSPHVELPPVQMAGTAPEQGTTTTKKSAAHLNAPSSQARHMLPEPRTPFVRVVGLWE